MRGWSFNGNAVLFCIAAGTSAIATAYGSYGFAVWAGLFALAACAGQICQVIKETSNSAS